ncbi:MULTISPECIES: type II toxin-antitoxin system Phd/YefM family antitoxin [Shinella]|uniref:type II toxin-antitoxin system Phd/YefM family antitoxin n=1 Tax=Shinella TaxID=323620 RepID=UPI0028A96CB6|nr:type II toxin-antitoxin system Phd/YefM family antitoxin [Shinella zoogloeoides]
MRFTYMTSAAFNQNPSKAKKAASERPLVITEHGEASYVLVRYSAFEENWRKPKSLYEALSDETSAFDEDFDPARTTFAGRDIEL